MEKVLRDIEFDKHMGVNKYRIGNTGIFKSYYLYNVSGYFCQVQIQLSMEIPTSVCLKILTDSLSKLKYDYFISINYIQEHTGSIIEKAWMHLIHIFRRTPWLLGHQYFCGTTWELCVFSRSTNKYLKYCLLFHFDDQQKSSDFHCISIPPAV